MSGSRLQAVPKDHKTNLESFRIVNATALKQQLSKFYRQIQRTDASDHI